MKTAEEILKQKKSDIISVTPDTTIYDALKIMDQYRIGAIVVKKGEEIAGIWTERDLLKNTITKDFNPKTALISEFMTENLQYASHDDNIYLLMDMFLGKRLRHLFVKKDGKCIGLLSSGDVTRASLIDKIEELEKLNSMVSWNYYENWRWHER